MDIQKEYLDLNNNFSYHKASSADWRGIGYMEIPPAADIYFMEWFYRKVRDGEWLVWNKHQECWNPCDYDFEENCPNIHWMREGVSLKPHSNYSTSQAVPEWFDYTKQSPRIDGRYQIFISGEQLAADYKHPFGFACPIDGCAFVQELITHWAVLNSDPVVDVQEQGHE
ncbi:hypothetical protein IL972_13025 [Acinetobacter sp. FL51]|uniref:hypothetical protein n=1 Tax=Acinetobacter sp. FL51 TaxID=2777978 RepID=UPI0018E13283|nr:hypothetical protein [Acinetobacter sp. FL51]MBI1452835.1 hypothetical protein [Acinetobacter sp. FL51]